MPHNIFGKKLGRDTNQRQALLKGLAGALIRSERIETTEAKATAAVSLIEKLVTQAKKATLTNLRQIEAVIVNKDLVDKLVNDIAPRFKDRPGGYLRLTKLGTRTGDNAPMVRMEFVASHQVAPATPVPPSPAPKKSAPVKKAKPKTKSK